MGNSNNDDDSCCCFNPPVIEDVFFPAYKIFKDIFISIQNKSAIKLEDIYLISIKSIDSFIKLIEKFKILEKIKENNDDDLIKAENNLKKESQQYQKVNNIIIYHSYILCEDLAKKDDDKENEFIIVNKAFIDKINTENIDNIDEQKVILNMNRNNSKMDILFPISQHSIDIIEKRTGIYKFVINKKEEKRVNLENKFNPISENNKEIMPRPDKSLS